MKTTLFLKQLLTISALLIMLLLQYGRQAAYLQCKLANVVAAQHCDCEKIVANVEDNHSDNNLPPLKIQTPDEWFVATGTIKHSFEKDLNIVKPTAFIPHFHAQLYRQKIIIPPKG